MNIKHTPLVVRGLGKTFPGKRPFTAVSEVSFALRAGEILGLLGPNGAGKSTTIQMLLGALLPTAGEISYFGRDLKTHRSQILEEVGYASGFGRLPWSLTVRENLEVQGRLYKLGSTERRKRIDELLAVFEIADQADKLTKSLSAGQSTRVMLARAFMGRPKIVLLDEPTAALDPDIAVPVRSFVLRECREMGVSMLYTSHNMTEVADLCQRVIFLKNGKIAAVDTPAELALKASLSRLRLKAHRDSHERMHIVLRRFGELESGNDWIVLSVDHRTIPGVLSELHMQGFGLDEIEIEKPTLEDFFIKLSGKGGAYEPL